MKSPFSFSLGLSLLLALASGCAASYQPIEPATVPFDRFQDDLGGGRAAIAWRYNVLKEAGNRYHARKEQQHGVSMLALRFTNNGQGALLFPEDVWIIAGADTLEPLTIQQVDEALRRTTAEDEPGVVEVDAGPLMALGSGLFKVNKQVRDNLRLARNLDTHYLQGRQVAPGSALTGLLGLPVAPGTGLKFELKKTEQSRADTLPPPVVNVPSGMITGLNGREILKMERISDDSGKEGIVVLDVCVDSNGRVNAAQFSAKGSTTLDQHLINLALENIRKWEFSKSAKEKECGRITYRFVSP